MNNKILTFLVLSVFVVGIASALIVNYMSEKAKVHQSVEYAMDVEFAKLFNDEVLSPMPILNVDGTWTSELISETTQLSTSLVGVKVTNNANAPIENKYLELVVSNDLNDVSCLDITSLQFLDTATQIQLDKGYQELSSLCIDLGEVVVYDIPINSLASNTEYQYPAKIIYGVVQPTIYHYDAQMVVNPTII